MNAWFAFRTLQTKYNTGIKNEYLNFLIKALQEEILSRHLKEFGIVEEMLPPATQTVNTMI